MGLLEIGILACGSVHLYVLYVNFWDSVSRALSPSLLLWTTGVSWSWSCISYHTALRTFSTLASEQCHLARPANISVSSAIPKTMMVVMLIATRP